MNDTTMRYKRTLDQAFPFGPEYGNPITCYEGNRMVDRAIAAMLFIGVLAVIASIAWGTA